MKSDPLPSKNPETLESMKERFSTKLTDILYEKLTVDNIETFADDALDSIIDLTANILDYYKNSGNLEVHNELELKDQEDDAYTQLGLPKISNILDLIEEKKNEIDRIKDKIKNEYVDTVITPPQENEGGIIPGNGNGFEKKKLIPRLLTLMYILENDLEVDLENVNITEGKVYDNMMRKTPYVRVEVEDLERLVYICDEEGNASYVFDTGKLKEKRISPEELDIDNKGDKNSLIQMHPGIGVRVVQTKTWRDRISNYLENEIPEAGEGKNMLGEVEEFESEKVESEFKRKEKKVFLPYKEWIQELKEAYDKTDKLKMGEFRKWYTEESKNHADWYTSFQKAEKHYHKKSENIYSEIGYIKKRISKEKFVPYEQFIEELETLYKSDPNAAKNFDDWYKTEAKKHSNWYSSYPHAAKAYGVTKESIYAIIGHEPFEFLSYDEFVKELAAQYKEHTAVHRIENFNDWYKSEVKKHPKWYKHISHATKINGRTVEDLFKSIGRENKFLPFDAFIKELKVVFESDKQHIINFGDWYRSQAKKNKGWYKDISNAAKMYGFDSGVIFSAIGYTPKRKR